MRRTIAAATPMSWRRRVCWEGAPVEYPALCDAVHAAEALDEALWSRRLSAYMAGKINLADYVVQNRAGAVRPHTGTGMR